MMQKILIVENDERIRRSIKRHLSREKYEVREAKNGKEGLYVLEDFPAELILLDVMMPIMDGYEMCEFLKSDTNFRDIFVLMISAKAKPEDKTFGLDIGADDYLTKPFDPIELIERIKKGLEIRQAWKDRIKDSQTGLFNRSFFASQLSREIAYLSREPCSLSIVLGRVDSFSKIVKTLEEAEINQIQKAVAKILTSNSRTTDTCARWNEEEFIVLLRATALYGARQFSEKVRKKVENHELLIQKQVTISLGVAELLNSDVELIKCATLALQKAQQTGGNRTMTC